MRRQPPGNARLLVAFLPPPPAPPQPDAPPAPGHEQPVHGLFYFPAARAAPFIIQNGTPP
ncbi:MAG: hypothetical protein H6650_05910 [Ardenticatenales bacterium]|nr:hypothetical protein [Ardenticatenales bacterium]